MKCTNSIKKKKKGRISVSSTLLAVLFFMYRDTTEKEPKTKKTKQKHQNK